MVSFIIIDYKSYERTIQFVKDAYERLVCSGKINIIIVDNSVDANNFDMIKEAFVKSGMFQECSEYILGLDEYVTGSIRMKGERGGVLLIQSAENGGYAKGNNIGARAAAKVFGDGYMVFSNNDILFEDDFLLDDLINPMKYDESIAVTGPRIIGTDGLKQSPHRKLGVWKMHIFPYLFWPVMGIVNRAAGKENIFTDLDIMDKSGYVYRVMGSFMAVKSSAFLEVGMFDENTFLYGEEMILSERFENKGYRTYYVDECSIIHEHGLSTEKSFKYIKTQKIKLDSSLYYHREYMGASAFEIALARIGFSMYEKIYFPLKNIIKGR